MLAVTESPVVKALEIVTVAIINPAMTSAVCALRRGMLRAAILTRSGLRMKMYSSTANTTKNMTAKTLATTLIGAPNSSSIDRSLCSQR